MSINYGNSYIWKAIEAYILDDHPDKHLFILGAPGIGKTYAVQEVCSKLNVFQIWIHSHTCGNAKEFKDFIEKSAQTSLMQSLSHLNQTRVIIVDELDTLIQLDRNIFPMLCDLLGKKIKCHVIGIGHHNLEKKIRANLPKSRVYVCTPPSESDICVWLRSFAKCSPESMLHIAEMCNGSLTHALQFLESEVEIGVEKTDVVQFQDVFNRKIGRADIVRLLSEDPWLHPLRYHENLPMELHQRKAGDVEKRKMYQRVLKTLLEWDEMMQNPNNLDVAMEHVASSIVTLQRYPRKLTGVHKEPTEFTKIFSNLSLHKKYERLLYSQNTDFPWMHAQIFCDYIKYR
jgi:hypothetical protein